MIEKLIIEDFLKPSFSCALDIIEKSYPSTQCIINKINEIIDVVNLLENKAQDGKITVCLPAPVIGMEYTIENKTKDKLIFKVGALEISEDCKAKGSEIETFKKHGTCKDCKYQENNSCSGQCILYNISCISAPSIIVSDDFYCKNFEPKEKDNEKI